MDVRIIASTKYLNLSLVCKKKQIKDNPRRRKATADRLSFGYKNRVGVMVAVAFQKEKLEQLRGPELAEPESILV